MHPNQNRIDYKGYIVPVLKEVSDAYGFGSYKEHKVIETGYEDFNVILTTNLGRFFLKFFAKFRDEIECQRYVDIMVAAILQGVSHPKQYGSPMGYMFTKETEEGIVRLVALEYIEGKTFYDMKRKPDDSESALVVQQAALINKMPIKPQYFYDDWAVVNLLVEFEKLKNHLSKEDIALIEPVVAKFSDIDIPSLPNCFVHGDIIDTNVLLADDGKVYVLDFSVANCYPRVQELAVMLCDILFNANASTFQRKMDQALVVYQEIVSLEARELEVLPIFVQAAHAMHIIGASKFASTGGASAENDHWLEVGRAGLKASIEFWGDI